MKNIKNMMLFFGLMTFGSAFGQDRVHQGTIRDIDASTLNDSQYTQNQLIISEGTFQLRITELGFNPLFSRELMDLIDSSRLIDSDVLINYSSKIKIFIPSEIAISEQNFQPLERVIYVSPLNSEEDEK